MTTDTATRIPGFVCLLGEAADAAIRRGIGCREAVARAVFALEAEYAAAGLPTTLEDETGPFAISLRVKEESDVLQSQ
jgi:hypothetical protein